MNQQIASFIPTFWQPHLEIDCEIIKRHLNDGDSVRVFCCTGEMPSCYGNLLNDRDTCNTCVARRRNAFNLMEFDAVELQNFVNITAADEEILQSYRGLQVESIEQLLSISLESCQIGRTVLNELASHLRDAAPDLVAHREYVTRAIESSALVYLSFKNHFKEFRPDRFYTFNGRFVVAYAAIAAAKCMQIPFAVHDRSFSMNKFITVYDDSLHAIRYWSSQAQTHWNDSADSAERKFEIATNWFDERLKGQKQGWFSFTTEQTDALPEGFDPQKTNVVLFNSSEFETVGMDDYQLPFYDDQNSGIERLARDLCVNPDVKLYLRMHPNLKDKDTNQTRFIRERLTEQFPNLDVIPADSPVSTYNLMKNATAVITFGSTTGVEAAFQRIPSILIAPSWYKVFDFCYTPETHEELVDSILHRKFVLSDAEAERRRNNAMKYAYFMATYGRPFQYFEQLDIFEIREKSKGPISYTAPTFEQGVKKEICARVELAEGARPNGLSGLVRELEQTVEDLRAQNETLQSQLAQVQHSLAGAKPGRIASSVHKISSLGRSFKRRLKKLL